MLRSKEYMTVNQQLNIGKFTKQILCMITRNSTLAKIETLLMIDTDQTNTFFIRFLFYCFKFRLRLSC